MESYRSLLHLRGMEIEVGKTDLGSSTQDPAQLPDTRKVLLDFGTHQGEGLHRLIKHHKIDETWDIYTFEANPYTYKHFEKLRDLLKDVPEAVERLPWLLWNNISYINSAIWEEDTEVNVSCIRDVHESITLAALYDEPSLKHLEFNLSNSWISGGSTIFKKEGDDDLDAAGKRQVVQMKAIDAATWIQSNFTANDHVVMKMDIEGAEGKVLMKMIKNRCIDVVNWIAVEWHIEELSAMEGNNGHMQYWLKGFVNGYLQRLEDEEKLLIFSWL